jgi:uncharacterized protein
MNRHGELARIARRFRLDAVYSFGSRADEARAFLAGAAPLAAHPSDLDLGVLTEAGGRLGARQRADLVNEFATLFQGAEIDLVLVEEAPAFLAADVVSGELLFVGHRDREAEYQLFVLGRAADLAPFERQRRAIVLAGGR